MGVAKLNLCCYISRKYSTFLPSNTASLIRKGFPARKVLHGAIVIDLYRVLHHVDTALLLHGVRYVGLLETLGDLLHPLHALLRAGAGEDGVVAAKVGGPERQAEGVDVAARLRVLGRAVNEPLPLAKLSQSNLGEGPSTTTRAFF